MILKVALVLVCLSLVLGEDSLVRTIHVPYPTRTRQVRKVMLPGEGDTMPRLVLNEKLGMGEAPLVKLLDGAYPVYYTTGKVNGQFNGMIGVLEE